MTPKQRAWSSAFFDWLVGWANGLRQESASYTVERLNIPVEDGVEIAADLYQPHGSTPAGTLLVRSPYGFDGFGGLLVLVQARIFAARRYQVLFTSCRGTFGSGGEFRPGQNELADGQAIVTWMRNQAWYTGSFATIGSSYLGYVQWALLSDPPQDMKAAVILTGLHDMGDFAWKTGAFNSDIIAWAEMLPRSGTGSLISTMWWLRSQPSRLRSVYDSAPLLAGMEKHFNEQTPRWLTHMVATPDLTDPSWKSLQQNAALEKANIPIYLLSGWYDIFLEPTIEQYAKLAGRGCTVALTIGPWQHLGTGDPDTTKDALGWFDEYLAGRAGSSRKSPVRVFVTGAREWRDLQKWPPSTVSQELFLGPSKRLAGELPPSDAVDSNFKFDPLDPTPSIGMPGLFDILVAIEDTPLATRPDVLTFTTEPLDQEFEVFGKPSVEIYHSSDNPHCDLFIRLSEVDSKGKSHTVTEQYLRLTPEQGKEPLHITLRDCAHVFEKGARIRLLIAGGCHPRFIRNLGTGENPATGSMFRPTWHTICHKPSAASKLRLPLLVTAS